MSAENVRKVLLRVLRDETFHRTFLESPEVALKEYDLSTGERELLRTHDRSLINFLGPTADSPAADQDITIVFTGMHDWFNVPQLKPAQELPREIFEQVTSLAKRVLGAESADRVGLLITLLQLLDGRGQR
jgi:hypothetical protein